MKALKFALIGVLGFGLIASLFPVTNAFAGDDNRTRLECEKFGEDIDTSLDARFESRDGRKKLSISFEAGQDTGFVDPTTGSALPVQATITTTKDGTTTTFSGNIALVVLVDGSVDGDLNYDTNLGEVGDINFPSDAAANSIGTNTMIQAGDLNCILE